MTKRRRNPQGFTTDEVQTATLIYTEGTFLCARRRRYTYPAIRIRMCVKEGLKPAETIFKRPIYPERTREIKCPPELFPPDGKGRWSAEVTGKRAEQIMERLKPLIPKHFNERWQKLKQKCKP